MENTLLTYGSTYSVGRDTVCVRELIGSGACCQVYSGEFLSTSQSVALKVFYSGDKYVGAFLRELAVLSSVKGYESRLVTFYGKARIGDRNVLITERLDYSLKDILCFSDVSSSSLLLQLVINDVARGLNELHEHGFILGDLKLSNVMWSGPSSCFKLIDFGLSFHQTEQLSHVIQCDSYRAPEARFHKRLVENQILEDELKPFTRPSFPSDIWSFGCLIYQLISGKKLSDDPHVYCKCKTVSPHECLVLKAVCSALKLAKKVCSNIEMSVPLAGALNRLLSDCLKCNPEDRTDITLMILNHLQQPEYVIEDFTTVPAALPSSSLKFVNFLEYGEHDDDNSSVDAMNLLLEKCSEFGSAIDCIVNPKDGRSIIVTFESCEVAQNVSAKVDGMKLGNGRIVVGSECIDRNRRNLTVDDQFDCNQEVCLLHQGCVAASEILNIEQQTKDLDYDQLCKLTDFIEEVILTATSGNPKRVHSRLHSVCLYNFIKNNFPNLDLDQYFESVDLGLRYAGEAYLLLVARFDWQHLFCQTLENLGDVIHAAVISSVRNWIDRFGRSDGSKHCSQFEVLIIESIAVKIKSRLSSERLVGLVGRGFLSTNWNDGWSSLSNCVDGIGESNVSNFKENLSTFSSFCRLIDDFVAVYNASDHVERLINQFVRHVCNVAGGLFRRLFSHLRDVDAKSEQFRQFYSSTLIIEWNVDQLLKILIRSNSSSVTASEIDLCRQQLNGMKIRKLPDVDDAILKKMYLESICSIVECRSTGYTDALARLVEMQTDLNAKELLNLLSSNHDIIDADILLSATGIDEFRRDVHRNKFCKLIGDVCDTLTSPKQQLFVYKFHRKFGAEKTWLTQRTFEQDLRKTLNQTVDSDRRRLSSSCLLLSLQGAYIVADACLGLALINPKMTEILSKIIAAIKIVTETTPKSKVCWLTSKFGDVLRANSECKTECVVTFVSSMNETLTTGAKNSLMAEWTHDLIIAGLRSSESRVKYKILLLNVLKSIVTFDLQTIIDPLYLRSTLVDSLTSVDIQKCDYDPAMIKFRSVLFSVSSSEVFTTQSENCIDEVFNNVSTKFTYEKFVVVLSKVLPRRVKEEWNAILSVLHSKFESSIGRLNKFKFGNFTHPTDVFFVSSVTDALSLLSWQCQLSENKLDHCIGCLSDIVHKVILPKFIDASANISDVDVTFVVLELCRLIDLLTGRGFKSDRLNYLLLDFKKSLRDRQHVSVQIIDKIINK